MSPPTAASEGGDVARCALLQGRIRRSTTLQGFSTRHGTLGRRRGSFSGGFLNRPCALACSGDRMHQSGDAATTGPRAETRKTSGRSRKCVGTRAKRIILRRRDSSSRSSAPRTQCWGRFCDLPLRRHFAQTDEAVALWPSLHLCQVKPICLRPSPREKARRVQGFGAAWPH